MKDAYLGGEKNILDLASSALTPLLLKCCKFEWVRKYFLKAAKVRNNLGNLICLIID